MRNQGKRDSQINFSDKAVSMGYIGALLLIIGFVLYEWLK
jgi:hypothetical protein